MIGRYTLPEMERIWTEENRWKTILEVEILACEAIAEQGIIPWEAVNNIRAKASFDIERIKEIESVTHHDVIAFLSNVAEYVGEDAKYMHKGLTSSDVLDTALSVQMKEAGELILIKLKKLGEVLKKKAVEHQDTIMAGRSHGVHAEPVTFGLKMALWYTENQRNIERMEEAIKTISVGKISGAVGTFANISPEIEEYVCKKMGIKPALVSTQIIQRDRHAHFMATLALCASSLDKYATELRHLQKTEVLEVEEPFGKGQKGSSAMPHKRNPVVNEQISGLARVIRGNMVASFENIALWHERDISHSSVERVILPDSTILLHYMLEKMIWIVENFKVNKDNMLNNLEKTMGLVFSQRVMLSLVEKGVARDSAYIMTQRNAMRAWDEKKEFQGLLLADEEIMSYLTSNEVEALFDYNYHTKNIAYILKRAGIFD